MGFNYEDSGYVDVAERIRQLKQVYPDAVLRPANPLEPFKLMEIGGREFIVYTAACYKSPDDLLPAIAVAAEPSFGKTPFTKDSEVMNAETSAWGRAILACLACDSHKVASADEVRNRKADQQDDDSWRDAEPVAPKRVAAGSAAKRPAPQASGQTVVNNHSANGAVTGKQLSLIHKLCAEVADGQLVPILQDLFSYDSTDNLTSQEASFLISNLMGRK
jgi:hypothetical protein